MVKDKQDAPQDKQSTALTAAQEQLESCITNTIKEKSLSPLAQKMAMQENKWKPPSFIETTKSFIETDVPEPIDTSKKEPIIPKFVIGKNKRVVVAAADDVHQQTELSKVDDASNVTRQSLSSITQALPSNKISLPPQEKANKALDNKELIELDEGYEEVMKLLPSAENDANDISMSCVIMAKR